MPTDIETLAGVFHPHAIEVQDFADYGLILDVRTALEFDDDHIPGAVHCAPSVVGPGPWSPGSAGARERPLAAQEPAPGGRLPEALESRLSALKLSQAILVYCGRGGLDSLPLARALRWRGWSVDVLPGGWINYRRWVQAGLEVLPRMLTYRVVATALSTETVRVLRALETVGHQVLNLGALRGAVRDVLASQPAPQASQAWFESQLVNRLRALDPRRPVWVGDAWADEGSVHLPGSLSDALRDAPVLALRAPIEERVRCWLEDEPAWKTSPMQVIDGLARSQCPPDRSLIERWRGLAGQGGAVLAACVLVEHLDRQGASPSAEGSIMARHMATLKCETLDPGQLACAVQGQEEMWFSGRDC